MKNEKGSSKKRKLDNDSRNGQTSQPKKQKPNTITPKQCLDKLAWLLEKAGGDCTAVCLVNKKLLVATNSLFSNSRTRDEYKKDNQTIIFQKKIISFLSNCINSSDDGQQIINELIKYVYYNKQPFQGELQYNVTKEERQHVLEEVLNNPGKSRHVRTPKIGALYGLAEQSKRRINDIVEFLKSYPNHPLCLALQSDTPECLEFFDCGNAGKLDRDWLLDDSSGSAILLINDGGVHAELKIIDFLLATRLLTLESVKHFSYFLGISLRCCGDCNTVVSVINEVCGTEVISVGGVHGNTYKKWKNTLPIFLLKPIKSGKKYQKELWLSQKNPKAIGYYIDKNKEKCYFSDLKEIGDTQAIEVRLYRDYQLIKNIREHSDVEEIMKRKQQIKMKHEPLSRSPAALYLVFHEFTCVFFSCNNKFVVVSGNESDD